MNQNKKSLVLSIVAVVTLIALVVGATYAFFQVQFGEDANADVNVTTNTVDQLSFRMFNNTPEDTDPAGISITAIQDNFNETDRQNVTGTTYGTATFTANNKTANDPSPAEITKTYNMYLDISENNFDYTTTDAEGKNVAELILTIMYSSTGNDVDYTEYTAAIEGLNRTTVEGITGYDLTKAQGLIKIAEDYEIKALSGATTTHKWKITLTFVNLDSNQNANTDKTFNATLKIQKEKEVVALAKYWNDNFLANIYEIVDNKPTTPELTYANVAELRTGYGADNFAANPYYIKTTDTEHQACLYYKETGKEFCLSKNYWDTDILTTEAKLQNAMKEALGVVESDLSCTTSSNYAKCNVSSFYCGAYLDGDVNCSGSSSDCIASGDGSAYCF